MQIPEKYLRIKTALLKEMSKMHQQHKLQTLQRISNLPYLEKLPEIKKLRERLNSENKKKTDAEPEHKTENLSVNRITQCITPPYTFGVSGLIDHPVSLLTGETLLNVFNPFGSVDFITGEISLSVISGQNFNDFYGGGELFDPGSDLLLYYKRQCGLISQLINLPTAFDYEILVKVEVTVELPTNYSEVVELIPGDSSSNLGGLVMADGYLDVYTNYDGGDSNSSTAYFLRSGKSAMQSEISIYENNPVCSHSFALPPRVTQFYIHVNPNINAYSGISNDPNSAISTYDYALIDLRAHQFENEFTIRRHFFNDHDHAAPGPIKIKKICMSYEPYYTKLPDTR